MSEPIIFDPTRHLHLLPHIVTVHKRCVSEPTHTIATFLPPIDEPKLVRMTAWWQACIDQITIGEKALIMQLYESEKTGKEEVAGVVMLSMPPSETGPFRAEVQKLLVLPEWRGKGVAGKMMQLLEKVAVDRERGLLFLDTEKGSPAEVIYPRLGWTKVGEIPRYEISPLDGSLKDSVIFYKDLR